MTDDNSTLVDMDAPLDDFEKDFFAEPKDEALEEEIVEEKAQDTGDDAAETDEDKDAPKGDDEDSDEDSDEDEDSEEKEEEELPKSKGRPRKSLQKRIDELTRRAYEAERREIEVLRRLEQREAQERRVVQEEPVQAHLPQGAPDPDAVDAKGDPIYPLGRFDPTYVEAITRFTIERELEVKRQQDAERQAALQISQAQEAIKQDWAQKMDQAEEESPEIREDIGELVQTFAGLDPSYGEYLALTVMQSENGPRILEYLSHNIGEAQKIVASGPAAATLAIGRLDAQFSKSEPKRNAKLVSDAPEPPEQVTKGRKGQRMVRPDTDNLSDFEKLFYDK